MMRTARCRYRLMVGTMLAILVAAGCTAFQVGGHIQKGRRALLSGEAETALAQFQRAAELNPDYVLNFSHLPQGVWTYVGRAHYDMGQYSQAGKAFDEAVSRHRYDPMARLYSGLLMAREGNRQAGVRETGAALQGIVEWLDDLERNHPAGAYWDPDRRLRSMMRHNLAMIAKNEVEIPKLIANGERLGKAIETEIDYARDDKIDDLYRRDSGDGGMD